MKNLSQRVPLSLLLASGVVFLGSETYRYIMAFKLFETGTLQFRNFPFEAVLGTIREFAQCAEISMIAYCVGILSLLVWFQSHRLLLKQRPWILMTFLLVIIYVPLQIAMLYKDWNLIGAMLWYNGEITEYHAKDLLLQRLTLLGGAPYLAYLGYISAIIIALVKPLHYTTSDE